MPVRANSIAPPLPGVCPDGELSDLKPTSVIPAQNTKTHGRLIAVNQNDFEVLLDFIEILLCSFAVSDSAGGRGVGNSKALTTTVQKFSKPHGESLHNFVHLRGIFPCSAFPQFKPHRVKETFTLQRGFQ